MTNIEVARLVTAIIVSAIAGYGIGFISSYFFTWHSATEIFTSYKLAIEGYKNTIKIWEKSYRDLADKYVDDMINKAFR